MANLDPLPPDLNKSALRASDDLHLSGEVKEEGVFASLVSSFRDVFFPVKLPPLVLESTPIAVPDLMKTKMSRSSIAASITFYILLFLLIAYFIRKHVTFAPPAHLIATNLTAPPPPPVAPKAEKIGGGGGQHDLAPVTQGHLPKFATEQIVPPKAPPTIAPKLAVEPTLVMQDNLKMADNKMPDIGAPNSNLKGVSMGNGNGGGIGSGNGNGFGPGSGGNTGGGVFHVGGSVLAPKILSQVEPEFSEEARKAKFSGNVLVSIIVDEQGNATHVHVVRGVGMGLDEKAVDAARQFKFKPATQNGKPVKVEINLEINFQIF